MSRASECLRLPARERHAVSDLIRAVETRVVCILAAALSWRVTPSEWRQRRTEIIPIDLDAVGRGDLPPRRTSAF